MGKNEPKGRINGKILFLDTDKGEVIFGKDTLLKVRKQDKDFKEGDRITMRIEFDKCYIKWRLNGVDYCGIYWQPLKYEILDFVPFFGIFANNLQVLRC